MKKQLGGDRIGAGGKMEVPLKGFERSTHNMSRVWRSTMAPGTLVPFFNEVAVNGDSFDIDLTSLVRTLPTNGPLFGSFKMQCDMYQVPIRLYNSMLHNNKLGIGMEMSKVKFPTMDLTVPALNYSERVNKPVEQRQFNQSSLLAYTGLRGLGQGEEGAETVTKTRQALFPLAYYDIFKNYYANKQEEYAYVIDGGRVESWGEKANSVWYVDVEEGGGKTIYNMTMDDPTKMYIAGDWNSYIQLEMKADVPNYLVGDDLEVLYENADTGLLENVPHVTGISIEPSDRSTVRISVDPKQFELNVGKVRFFILRTTVEVSDGLKLQKFRLENIDDAREEILSHRGAAPFNINDLNNYPYQAVTGNDSDGFNKNYYPLQGLCVKTYQSDIFNNWLSTEWIDGTNGISAVTSVDTTGDSFTLDALSLAKKVYDMLNRIAVSGGTYEDWQEAVYSEQAIRKAETPIYIGGMSCEIVFDEVVSTADASTASTGDVALGSLAGRGTQRDFKGGQINVKVKEPSIIIGIASLTPRIDYSQGNKWYTRLESLDDLHKPSLDGIGFQELITEQMAFWENRIVDGEEVFQSAGKQPAWLNWMTAYNETFGNFADRDKEMYMTLNRNYVYDEDKEEIADLTTYIDPTKYNYAFADASLEAQNFWVQIAADVVARRKISAKIIPNV